MAYMGGTLSVAALDGAVLTRIAASHIPCRDDAVGGRAPG